MKTLITIAIIGFSSSFLFAQDYNIDNIPEELKKNSDAVVRSSVGKFEILSIDKAKYSIKEAVTILNDDGNHNASIAVFYDKLTSVSNFSVAKYDASGERIFKSKGSDVIDQSATSGGTFFDDNRIMGIDVRQDDFPYTVEFEYNITYKFLYFIPKWHFYSGTEESVEFSRFELISPLELAPRFLSVNTEEPTETNTGGILNWVWEQKNLKPIDPEPYGPSFWEVAPHVVASPSKFEFDGYRGDLSTWDGFALWQNELNKGKEALPEATIAKVKELTQGMDDLKKIRTIYEYLQSKTRYVSVQLGIGGFQPFPATMVDEEGYGDCKALSFYTKSLLDAVDIKSNYTIVYGGNNPPTINKDFPSPSYFNHVILSVPLEQDTVWLECTSQTNPFGYLGNFTSDRDVFVVTENGGKIVRTPKYSIEDNIQTSKTEITIFENGNGEVSFANNYQGLKYEYSNLDYYILLGDDKKKEWIEKVIDIPSFAIGKYEFTNNRNSLPSAEVKGELSVNRLVSKSGTRFFLQPNLMNKNTFIPNKDENRESKIKTGYAYQEIDSVIYTLPEGHYPETIFEPVDIQSIFGSYNASLTRMDDGNLLYVRRYLKNGGEYQNTEYESYIDFNKKIVRADKKRISFKKKT